MPFRVGLIVVVMWVARNPEPAQRCITHFSLLLVCIEDATDGINRQKPSFYLVTAYGAFRTRDDWAHELRNVSTWTWSAPPSSLNVHLHHYYVHLNTCIWYICSKKGEGRFNKIFKPANQFTIVLKPKPLKWKRFLWKRSNSLLRQYRMILDVVGTNSKRKIFSRQFGFHGADQRIDDTYC